MLNLRSGRTTQSSVEPTASRPTTPASPWDSRPAEEPTFSAGSPADVDAYAADAAARVAQGYAPAPLAGLGDLSGKEQKELQKKIIRELNRQAKEAKREAKRSGADKAQARRASEILRERERRAKELGHSAREKRNKREAANTTCELIGYDLMYKNGICEVEPGRFSETIAFDDISYQNIRDDDQISVLKVISDMLNYFGQGLSCQFSVINMPLRAEEVGTRRFFDPDVQATAAARADAIELNSILNKKLKEGVSNIRRVRLLSVAAEAPDIDEATRRFARVNTDLGGYFERMKCAWKVLDGAERLLVVNDILRPQTPLDFDYDRDLSPWSGYTTKDFISPTSMDFKPAGESAMYTSDGKWCQCLVMRSFSSPLSDRVVSSLIDLACPIDVSWYVTPIDKAKATKDLKVHAALIDKEVIDNQKEAVKQGYDYSILPSEVSSAKSETDDLLARISGQSQNLFFFSGLIWTWADSLEELVERVGQITDTARANGIEVDPLPYRQRQAMNSILPLGTNHVEVVRYMTTDEACIFVPFANDELEDAGGNWYYQNRLSNNLVLGDRGRLTSPIGFVAGKTGSGKGFFVKNEIEGTILSKPYDQIIIFDRAGEYIDLTEHHGGTVANFGPDSESYLNPLGMVGVENRSTDAQIAFKADAILAQASASAEAAGFPLSDEDRSIIQRCVELVYHDYEGTGKNPILEDFWRKLNEQPEPQAKQIALRYEMYIKGSMNFFNHADTVDFSNRIIDLNIKDVPGSMLVFALITMCEAVRNQMYKNHDRGIRTWLYVEEMESLFKYPAVLDYFRRLANECRKYGMFLTGITQSTESMIGNEDVSSIVKNSDFIMLLKQSAEDRRYWTQALGLSEREAGCIDESTPRGYGLLLFGASRIPIKGDFPTDSNLYKIYSTDPNETEIRKSRERRKQRRKQLAEGRKR